MANKVIKLTAPIEGFGDGVQIKQIVLRAPKYADVMALGEPSAYAQSAGGLVYSAEKESVIQGYIERLLEEPKDPQILLQLELADTLALKDAVHSFFAAARRAAPDK